MELGIFTPSRPADDFNGLPEPRERRGLFWSLVEPLLGIPDTSATTPLRFQGLGASRIEDRNWEYDAVARRDRRIAELNNAVPFKPTLGEVLSEVVEAVREAVKLRKPTELQRAKTWLQETLSGGPMLATAVEKLAIKAGISKRTLRRAAKSVKVQSRRKGRGPWVWSPLQAESHDGQER